jgi:hypothetical protein
MGCARCGRECTGMYCDSCKFYEMNDQCWRCRMYLPKVELQQWRGQIYCPYCIQDLRSEELESERRRNSDSSGIKGDDAVFSNHAPGGGDSGSRGSPDPYVAAQPVHAQSPNVCDRCKSHSEKVYVSDAWVSCESCLRFYIREEQARGIKKPNYIIVRGSKASLWNRLMIFARKLIWHVGKIVFPEKDEGKEK